MPKHLRLIKGACSIFFGLSADLNISTIDLSFFIYLAHDFFRICILWFSSVKLITLFFLYSLLPIIVFSFTKTSSHDAKIILKVIFHETNQIYLYNIILI